MGTVGIPEAHEQLVYSFAVLPLLIQYLTNSKSDQQWICCDDIHIDGSQYIRLSMDLM
jgi:hypothetical protein